MASGLALWEMDPLFAAAEDVQQSADRMESVYRNWLHIRALTEENAVELRSAELSHRELLTALDTAKWQLEEFKKAAMEALQVHSGEGASKRHFSFIEAIWGQISTVENAVHESVDLKSSNSLDLVNFSDDERNQLAMFLSGCSSMDLHTQGHGHSYSIEGSDLAENSLVDTHKGHTCHEIDKRKYCRSEVSSDKLYSTRNSGLPSTSNGFVYRDSGTAHRPYKEIVEADDSILHKGVNELNSSKESDWQDSWQSPLEIKIGSNTSHTNIPFGANKLTNGSRPWNFFVKATQIDEYQTSRNGLKRGKNGCQGVDAKEHPLFADSNGLLFDLEGGFNEDSRSNRRSVRHGEKQPSRVGKWTMQHLLFGLCMPACSPSGQRVSAIVLALCLCCMYFWFLSSLVPSVTTTFPHKFQG